MTSRTIQALASNPSQCEAVMENLRFGIPPRGRMRDFTVGRADELARIDGLFGGGQLPDAMLIQANYGAGKTHLLRVIEDRALDEGYLVSYVEVAARDGVRFNRMDQVAAAVCRRLEFPDGRGGISRLLDTFVACSDLDDEHQADRQAITDGDEWQYSDSMLSAGLWLMLRAHALGSDEARCLAVHWLTDDDRKAMNRTQLLQRIVWDLRIDEVRKDWQLLDALNVSRDGAAQCWGMLRDLDGLARMSGYRGLVVLFDEFEDVLQNLRNRSYERMALENLFRFADGEAGVSSFYSVTPEFVGKARDLMLAKEVYTFRFHRLDQLQRMQFTPVDFNAFRELAVTITQVHGWAYGWIPEEVLGGRAAVEVAARAQWREHDAMRVRNAVTGLVSWLDGFADP